MRGRFECIKSPGGPVAIIDYAHTPHALQNVLNSIHKVRRAGQNIITVVGAGGNRDKQKRPKMARIAVEYSDKVIFTTDNPREEDPLAIIDDMMKGVEKENKVLVIADRREAIRTAIMLAGKKDVILVAGKGHETYQEVKGKRFHFDDKEIVEQAFLMNN